MDPSSEFPKADKNSAITRFRPIRESSQASVKEDIKTSDRGIIVKSISRENPEQQNVWGEMSAQKLADNYRRTLSLVQAPEFGLAQYVAPTRIQVVDGNTINIVQREIVGQTLEDYIWELQEAQGGYENLLLPAEVLSQLNDILSKTINMAIRTMDYPRERLPRGVTTRSEEPGKEDEVGLPEWRDPKEGEGVFVEVLSGNALNNLMIGIPFNQRDNPEAKPQLWITDCTDAMLTDLAMAKDTAKHQLTLGYGSRIAQQIDPQVLKLCDTLDEQILTRNGKPANSTDAKI